MNFLLNIAALASISAGIWGAGCTSVPQGSQKVSGYDLRHQFQTATLLAPGTMCTEIFTEGEQYAADCQKAGFESFRIECHAYLCSGNLARRK